MKRTLRFCACVFLSFSLLFAVGCGGGADGSAPEASQPLSSDAATAGSARDIPFRTNACVRLAYGETLFSGENGQFAGRIVSDKEQYDALKLEERQLFANYAVDLTPYTQAYFSDKALIVLYCTTACGTSRVQVDTLTASGNVLTVGYTQKNALVGTDDGGEWCVLLEVDRAAVQNVSQIVGERTEVTLSFDAVME